MDKTIKLNESELKKIIAESIDEINAHKPNLFKQMLSVTPAFDSNNKRHMKAYDIMKDSVMYVINTCKLRPNVVRDILRDIEDDLYYNEL